MTPGENLLEVVRCGRVESVHCGHLLVLDATGATQLALGAPETLIFPRSAVKAIQAAAMVRCGLELPPELLALACASHSGTPAHQAGVRQLLARAGLSEERLRNTPDRPLGATAREAWGDRPPTPLAANCSGKHAAMLAASVHNGWDLAHYLDPAHPAQLACRAELERLSGEAVAQTAVDGCGAPLFCLSLRGLAEAVRCLLESTDPVHRRVVDACCRHPWQVGGEGRLATLAMQAKNDLFVKDGAEGVMVAGLAGRGALAFKMSDGSARGASVLLSAALRVLGVPLALPPELVYGGGRPVGELRVSPALRV